MAANLFHEVVVDNGYSIILLATPYVAGFLLAPGEFVRMIRVCFYQ